MRLIILTCLLFMPLLVQGQQDTAADSAEDPAALVECPPADEAGEGEADADAV